MLRTLGASRRQILTTVIVEAVAIGLIGSLLGIAGGFLIAMLLNALLRRLRHRPADDRPRARARTVVVSLLVGVLVTLVSSLVPALRSTRVPPIAALHAFTPAADPPPPDPPPACSRSCSALAGLALVLGRPLRRRRRRHRGRPGRRRRARDRPRRLPLQPAPGAAAGVGRRLAAGEVRRLTGRLARENAQRNPSRTAVTAAALMIGLALVAFVTVFAAGLKSSVAQVVDENFAGGIVIQNTDGFSPIPAGAAAAAAKVPGVESVATIRSAQAKLLDGGAERRGHGADPDIDEAVEVEWKQGGPETLRDLARRRGGRLRLLRLRQRPRGRRPLPPADPDRAAGPASRSPASSTPSSASSAASSSPSRRSPATSTRPRTDRLRPDRARAPTPRRSRRC